MRRLRRVDRIALARDRHAMMNAHLSSLTYAAIHRDAVILLNVADDAYAVMETDVLALSPSRPREVEIYSMEAAREMREAGLTADAPEPETLGASVLVKRRRALPLQRAPIRCGDLVAFVVVLSWTVPTFRFATLEAVLRSAARRRQKRARVAPDELVRLTHVFHRLLVWSPWQGRCLFRSLLLLRFLRARGGDASWVLGARTWPFLAHCWLQAEDMVLNDDPDRLMGFTGLLAV